MPLCCKICGNKAILKRPKTGDALCKECFYVVFETEVHHTIMSNKLFTKGQVVAIGASGGKDSTVLAYVLKKLNEEYDYGLKLILLSVDEGITGYRDDSLETVKRNEMQYELPLKIVSYEELYGWTMDAIVKQIGLKNNCTFCGVFRRQALDRGAVALKVDKIVTGHNADDIAETVLMNVLRGDIARLRRCTAIVTGTEGAIPRCKPFKYTYEKEIVMYAYFKKLDYFSTECIYSPNVGFDCIWITPVVDSNGFMGYDAENIFEIESHFGSKEDLKRLSNKLHERSMCLILDIVLNHVRPLVINGRVNLSTIVPFNHESHYNQRNRSANQSFEEYLIAWPPPPFNPSEDNHRLRTMKMSGELDCGHHVAEHTECACFPGNMGFSCPSSSTADIATGYLGVLGDLNHSNPFVRQTLLKWVREMVQNYSLDALRLDTAIYLERDFLPEVQEAAAVQVLGEATVNNLTYQASLMHGEAQKGLLGLLNFPPFYQLPRAFCGYRMGGEFGDYSLQGTWYDEADMTGLGSVLSLQLSSNKHSDLDMMGNFADNHDEYSRLAYFCRYDSLRIRQALVWVFLTRGIPILYYGTEQGLDGHQGPHNNKGQDNLRESLWQTGYRTDTWQYRFVRKLNMLRKHLHVGVGSAEIKNTSKTTLVFTRETTEAGTIWVFLNNAQNATEMEGQIYCPGPSGRLQGRWFDALSGKAVNRYLKAGCFEAPDRHPKILFRKGRR